MKKSMKKTAEALLQPHLNRYRDVLADIAWRILEKERCTLETYELIGYHFQPHDPSICYAMVSIELNRKTGWRSYTNAAKIELAVYLNAGTGNTLAKSALLRSDDLGISIPYNQALLDYVAENPDLFRKAANSFRFLTP